VLAGAELEVVGGGEDVELELLLPQPTATADTALTTSIDATRRAGVALTKTTVSL
jgi:hypothetical protein